MPLSSGCFNTTVTGGAGVPAMDFKAGANGCPKVMEAFVQTLAATASTYALGRSGNTPAQTGTTALAFEDPGNTATSNVTSAVTWGTAPTAPSVWARRCYLPATAGAGMIFTFPKGYGLLASAASFVLWTLAASSASTNCHVVVDE